MKREREERRRKAAEVKALRAEEAKDAEGKGGIESVEFLRKIHDYRAEHHIGEAMAYTGGDLWGGGGETRILVCVRKRPMLRAELGRHDFDVVSVDPNHSAMILHEPKTRVDLVKSVEHHRRTIHGTLQLPTHHKAPHSTSHTAHRTPHSTHHTSHATHHTSPTHTTPLTTPRTFLCAL